MSTTRTNVEVDGERLTPTQVVALEGTGLEGDLDASRAGWRDGATGDRAAE